MTQNKDKTIIAMKKAQSLLQKIIKMLQEDKYCIDIIQQNLAVIGLIKSANVQILEGHINNCVKNAAKEKNAEILDKMIGELSKIMKLAQNK